MPLVAGVDSSTQACKVVVRDADPGSWSAQGRAAHPAGHRGRPAGLGGGPDRRARRGRRAGTTSRALSVGGQQHGMVCLDEAGDVVRPALLWNDTRSADAAADLVAELGAGGQAWADAVGVVPVASFTGAKLRWLADAEPGNADRTAAVCLPHDWLTWRLSGAAGAGLAVHGPVRRQRHRLLVGPHRGVPARTSWSWRCAGRSPRVPRVAGPAERVGQHGLGGPARARVPGTTPRPPSAWAPRPGDVVVSIGTSGVVTRRCPASRPPTRPAPWPGSPTPPAGTCRWSAR